MCKEMDGEIIRQGSVLIYCLDTFVKNERN